MAKEIDFTIISSTPVGPFPPHYRLAQYSNLSYADELVFSSSLAAKDLTYYIDGGIILQMSSDDPSIVNSFALTLPLTDPHDNFVKVVVDFDVIESGAEMSAIAKFFAWGISIIGWDAFKKVFAYPFKGAVTAFAIDQNLALGQLPADQKDTDGNVTFPRRTVAGCQVSYDTTLPVPEGYRLTTPTAVDKKTPPPFLPFSFLRRELVRPVANSGISYIPQRLTMHLKRGAIGSLAVVDGRLETLTNSETVLVQENNNSDEYYAYANLKELKHAGVSIAVATPTGTDPSHGPIRVRIKRMEIDCG